MRVSLSRITDLPVFPCPFYLAFAQVLSACARGEYRFGEDFMGVALNFWRLFKSRLYRLGSVSSPFTRLQGHAFGKASAGKRKELCFSLRLGVFARDYRQALPKLS